MKIYAFEVREDERASFAKYEEEFGVKITCTDQPLTRENMDLLDGYQAITTLGMMHYGQKNWTPSRRMAFFTFPPGPSATITLMSTMPRASASMYAMPIMRRKVWLNIPL